MHDWLNVCNLIVYHADKCALQIETLSFAQNKWYAIIGPNGAGKSSLLRALTGSHRDEATCVWLEGKSLATFSDLALAQKRAVLSQRNSIAFPLTVAELVRLGREPYRASQWAEEDALVCQWALEQVGLSAFAQRSALALSGGEQQRAHIARVLAQLLPGLTASLAGKWLLLDEPINHLDIHHQYQLFVLMKSLLERGLTLITILHDPALAINQADEVVLLKNGRLFGQYSAKILAQNQALSALYAMDMPCRWCEESQRYYLTPALRVKNLE